MALVIDIPDIPETQHRPRERGRLQVRGRRTDDGSDHTLLVINEVDGSWTIHGLGTPGVRLAKDAMVTVAESILRCAR